MLEYIAVVLLPPENYRIGVSPAPAVGRSREKKGEKEIKINASRWNRKLRWCGRSLSHSFGFFLIVQKRRMFKTAIAAAKTHSMVILTPP